MELKFVESLPGSPATTDVFVPHMPGVDVLSDMDALFAMARDETGWGSNGKKGQGNPRHVVILTPGRILITLPMLDPARAPIDPARIGRSVFRSNRPLTITMVSYTQIDALVPTKGVISVPPMNRAIPFLGYLISFADAGDAVIVFEGHPSAFQAGVRNSDVLIIDSAMLPFLQKDWAAVAFAAISKDAHIFVFQRDHYGLIPVARIKNEPGWRYTEDDGEASYANCLLTTMARSQIRTLRIVAGSSLPNLAQMTTDPQELEWISVLPFKYDQLDAAQVIDVILGHARRDLLAIFKRSWTLKARLAPDDGERELPLKNMSFKLTESRSEDGRRQLDVELQ